jgi:L,D-peptidoglycan transpeptidase YkuD (ErfK/YbiS/YcfS/YnhG family)
MLRARPAWTALTAVLAVLAVLLAAHSAPAAASVPPYHPSRLAHVGDAAQVVVVTAPTWRSTHGTMRAYERDGHGGWREVVGATPARLGWSGMYLAAERRQGSGRTPAGTFAIPRAFGRLADPGTRLPYTRFDRNDSWTYDPAHPLTYNVFQSAPIDWRDYGGYAEHLWAHGKQYRYIAVLDYNLPTGPIRTGADGIRRSASPPDTKAGGGIFLHVTDGRSTAGCIAIPEAAMRDVLRWLDPRRKPVIVIGPASVIGRM